MDTQLKFIITLIDGTTQEIVVKNNEIAKTFQKREDIISIAIPNGIENISNYAFQGCPNLREIAIPNSVKSIGEGAFSGSGLKNLIIPNSVENIGNYAFYGCGNIKELIIPSNVNNIGEHTFGACCNLEKLEISKNIITIENYAFHNCAKLSHFVCYDVTNADYNALDKLIVPPNVTSIGEGAFDGGKNLKSIVLPSNLKYLGKNVFRYCESIHFNEYDNAYYI